MLTVVAEEGAPREGVSLLDDIVREGPRRMLAAALEAEVDAYLAELAHERDERGRRLVVRNGHAEPRQVMTSAGAHEVAAPLAALPKSAHPGAKAALAEIYNAEDKRQAQAAANRFAAAYGAKFAKAVAKVTDDLEVLLAFYDFPAEHWVHLRTSNPIESTFATVRHRTRVTKGPGSRAAGLAMAFKLIESAQDRWRAVNAPHFVALVRADAVFKNGKLVEHPGDHPSPKRPKSLEPCHREIPCGAWVS